ncbi:MAG: hypothetical protein CVV27_07300 [Candidatus Melainabacteria bacterium HGW-Melainabacteria-1]|nr:MAG: hypothetical protein CVV27_07300 [Candidatus Melainabacteria bacterium HGW-Melainabacteria-1]
MTAEFLRDPPLEPGIAQAAYAEALRRLDSASGHQRLGLLGKLGTLARGLRDYDAANRHFRAAIAMAEYLADPVRITANQVRLGVVLHHSGELEAAIACFEAVLAVPDQGYHDFAWQHLGKLWVELGRDAEASACFSQALALRQAKGDQSLLASTTQAIDEHAQWRQNRAEVNQEAASGDVPVQRKKS